MGTLVSEADDISFFKGETDSSQTKAASLMEQGSLSASFGERKAKSPNNTLLQSFKIVILSNKLNLLLPFGPLAMLVHYVTDNKGCFFVLSLVGITPLAERLGYATEQLAYYTGSTVGGLLNATFGNVTELIISIFALRSGMIRVVQLTLLGSILSKKAASFSLAGNAVVNSGMLLMAVVGLFFPTLLHYTHSAVHSRSSELALSRFTSCIMLVAYAAYLFFQLKRHPSSNAPLTENEETSEDDEDPEISKWEAIIWLLIFTAWVSLLSGYLVEAWRSKMSEFENKNIKFLISKRICYNVRK